MIEIDGSFWAIWLKGRGATGESALLCPDGESSSSGCDDARGQTFKWMHQLKTAYTVYFNRRHQVVGHLFQSRFKSTVEAEKIFAGSEPPSHLNPVRGMALGNAFAALYFRVAALMVCYATPLRSMSLYFLKSAIS
jgi:hypothetical protein